MMEPVDENAVQGVVMPYRPRETSETGLWAVTIRDAHNVASAMIVAAEDPADIRARLAMARLRAAAIVPVISQATAQYIIGVA